LTYSVGPWGRSDRGQEKGKERPDFRLGKAVKRVRPRVKISLGVEKIGPSPHLGVRRPAEGEKSRGGSNPKTESLSDALPLGQSQTSFIQKIRTVMPLRKNEDRQISKKGGIGRETIKERRVLGKQAVTGNKLWEGLLEEIDSSGRWPSSIEKKRRLHRRRER